MPFPSRNHPHGWGSAHADWHAPWWDSELEARRFQRRSSAKFRLWFPVILSLLIQLPPVFVHWTNGRKAELVEWASPQQAVLAILVAAIGPLALIGARRFPGPVVAIVAVAASADLLLAGAEDGPPYIAFAFAIGAAIVRGARVWAWAVIAASWIGTLLVAFTLGLTWQPWRVVGISFGILLVVGLAEGIRTRGERYAVAMRAISARRQSEVQAERVRIARELHDVLAHSLSQINVQAGVGLHLIDKQPDKAADALASIKETSKAALDEVRSVLGILRSEAGADAPLVPEPDLSRLAGLAASVIAQGVDVVLTNRLENVPKPTQLALYRIVQESLTNVVRHAEASRATVELSEEGGSCVVVVTDNGKGASGAAEPAGRGLLGMHERAELLGGTLEAGPVAGGFRVRATIPMAGEA
jgi:signal transduction histidine kinase